MNKDNIIMKLDSVSQALNSITVTGIQNMMNLAGCYTILQEIKNDLRTSEEDE